MTRLAILFAILLALPAQGTITHDKVQLTDGIELRLTRVAAQGHPKNVVVVFQGREAFYEKSEGFYKTLAGQETSLSRQEQVDNPFCHSEQSCDVWVIERRGTGESGGRLGAHDQRDHADDFGTYLDDYNHVIRENIIPQYRENTVRFHLLGISMGGHLALRYQQIHGTDSPFTRVLLVAPMVQFRTDRYPLWMARGLSRLMVTLGYGQTYALGKGPLDPDTLELHREKSHHDAKTFQYMQKHLRENPHKITGGPTYGWVAAAFASLDACAAQRDLLKNQDIHFFVPGDDHVVDPYATLELARHLGKESLKYYPGAWHSLMLEIPTYQAPFIQDLHGAIMLP